MVSLSRIYTAIKLKVLSVLKKGNFILGQELAEFEKEFAKYCGVKHAIGVGSGTEAILIALRALEIGRGNEVIVPANTFISGVVPILYVGAKPVLVDINPETYNIDVNTIEERITKRSSISWRIY